MDVCAWLCLVLLIIIAVGFDIVLRQNNFVLVGGPVDSGGAARSTVFINDVAFEVAVGPFNVREAFGDNVVLIHSSGQPVLTNEWGVSLQPLQHGAFYYLVPLSTSENVSSLFALLFLQKFLSRFSLLPYLYDLDSNKVKICWP